METFGRIDPRVGERRKELAYQNIADVQLREAASDEQEDVSITVSDLESKEEAEEAAKKWLKNTNWWLQDYWREKGFPKEQVIIEHPYGKLEVFNFSNELNQRHLNELRETIALISRLSNGEYLSRFRYILINDASQINPNSGTSQWGARNSVTSCIELFPEALSFEPHRVSEASIFAGTLIHEAGHYVADDLKREWMEKFGWEMLEAVEPLPGGGVRNYRCTQPDRCISEYATYKPDEDTADSLVGFFSKSERLDKERAEFLEAKLLTGEQVENGDNIKLTHKKGEEMSLPMIDRPIKYKKEKKKRFKITI